jgi:hypothetical protein
MGMAGIVCYDGTRIIMITRQFIETLGRPLELDTEMESGAPGRLACGEDLARGTST